MRIRLVVAWIQHMIYETIIASTSRLIETLENMDGTSARK